MSNTEIQHIEKLARLSLSATERETMCADLENILQMVRRLDELDTDDTEPLVYLSKNQNPMRADELAPHLDRKTVMQNAPLTDGTYFKVPKVIDIR